ncbi:choice-of-anchor tandem repeat GloVer-containing protein [Segetibacter koreensis]|uniref:choice-of-anchor tandem repeat GloVer-containing protein n=1 Tax=Segetibacter koreensis TaxID=398037 RepID=UPI000379D605|nr:choice-of-anchor tandem repeat GloVer-containing protein [Segetibacter koreensis]
MTPKFFTYLLTLMHLKRFFIKPVLTAFILSAVFGLQAQDVLVGLTSNGGPEGKGTAYSIKTNATGFSILKAFVDWGSSPVSSLVRGTDGNLYGMASEGGSYGHGTIFKMTPGGTITILKNLNLYVDGGYPKGSLIQAKDGNFYGMTSSGSINNGGCIFKITSSGTYTIIRSLSVNTDGGRPQGHLIQTADGNFYGINYAGGVYGYGNIFKMTPSGQYTVLKSFNKTDGGQSYGSLVQADDGAFYGMTYLGGKYSYGVIFRITSSGSYTVIRHLNATDGVYPSGDLIQAKDGYLYGMAPSGGNYNGTIFKINTTGTSFKVLRALSPSVEGGNPKGSLLQASDGLLYGMTYSMSGGYSGSVFKMTLSGAVTVIKKLTNATDGGYPMGSLVQTPDGLLYGMTNAGGKNTHGTIFKITSSGSLTVLNHLNGATQGNLPQDNLAVGNDGAYYGVTKNGGTYDFGTIFKICGGVTTVLRSFNRNVDGGNPQGGLLKGTDGNFYGMTESGGSYSSGTIYKITPSGQFTVLRHLKGTTDGESPRGTLVQGKDGLLYGMTYSGGTGASGTIFKISTTGTFTVLRNLVYSTDGNASEAGLVQGKDGAFYGMTGYNTRFFKITSGGAFSILRTLAYSTDGNNPSGNLVQGTDGAFYGTMSGGGTYSGGVIFKITTGGVLTKLRQLNPSTDGSYPKGGLVQAADGYFYGTTSAGGTYKTGTIFKISSGGSFSVLRHLDIAKDGGTPLSGLIIAPKNTLVANAQSLTISEDASKAIVLSGSGGSPLTFTIVRQPKNGSVTSGTSANRTYTPNGNYAGKDSFAFTANVGCMASAPQWIKINVTAVNDAPVLAPIGNKTIAKGATLKFTATATDDDAGQTKTFSLLNAPAGASISATTGAFSWTPTATGSYTFKVRVADNGSPALYDEEQLTVTVTATLTAGIAAARPSSEAMSVETKTTVSLETKIYPNPVTDRFTITFNIPVTRITAIITDVRGSVINTTSQQLNKNNKLEMNAANLKAGTYFIQVQTEVGRQTLQFIKM